ncbi:ABC transporter permease subunit [Halolamina sp. CBA1230]|uniref:ABC transporter permease subunit n=1 Tax=Halolamina sp. CBA1230 TaxID=1853690 RepID=UPI001C3D3B8A|nr:ABC transporter permease subunit [Halolamina sp. CBA1230]
MTDPPGWLSATWTVAAFEGRERLRMGAVIAALLAAYGALFVWVGPDLVAGEELQGLLDAMPPVMVELLGFESLASLSGLLAGEYYTFGWLVGLAGYVAYTAAGSVAGDLESDRMDTVLAAPVPRGSVLLGNFLALLVPILIVNAVVPPVLYVAAAAVGESLPLDHLLALHALSVPYLLCWGAVGLLLGVVIGRSRVAGRIALALVFASWLFESVLDVTDYAEVAAITPTRYLDPSAVLLEGEYDLLGTAVLVAATAILVTASRAAFARRDL